MEKETISHGPLMGVSKCVNNEFLLGVQYDASVLFEYAEKSKLSCEISQDDNWC